MGGSKPQPLHSPQSSQKAGRPQRGHQPDLRCRIVLVIPRPAPKCPENGGVQRPIAER